MRRNPSTFTSYISPPDPRQRGGIPDGSPFKRCVVAGGVPEGSLFKRRVIDASVAQLVDLRSCFPSEVSGVLEGLSLDALSFPMLVRYVSLRLSWIFEWCGRSSQVSRVMDFYDYY